MLIDLDQCPITYYYMGIRKYASRRDQENLLHLDTCSFIIVLITVFYYDKYFIHLMLMLMLVVVFNSILQCVSLQEFQ